MDFTSAPSILIIDDDTSLRSLLTQLLGAEGFRTTAVGDVQGGLRAVAAEQPALVLLDRGLPDADGLSIVEELRRRGGGCPVVLLTARDAVQDRVDGLEAGADDYILKPFDSGELTARIRAHLRRAGRVGELAPQLGDLTLDPLRRTVTRAGRLAKLTQREYSLLAVLIRHAGETISREQLALEAWEQEAAAGPAKNTVDVYVAYLRSKIEHDDLPPLLHTVRGAGYVLQARTTPSE
jgi:two-component system, OmpR family, response regulator MprA